MIFNRNLSAGSVRYLENTVWMLSEKLLQIGMALFIGIWVARYLGPEKFGLLSFAQSLVGLFGSFASLGIINILSRELVQNPLEAQYYLSTSIAISLVGSFLSFAFLTAFLLLRGYDEQTSLLSITIGVVIFFQVIAVFQTYYQSLVQGRILAFSGALGLVVASIFKITLLVLQLPLYWFAISIVFDSLILFIIFFIYYSKNGPRVGFEFISLELTLNLMKQSWPYILSGVMVTVYMKIDQVMIKEMMGNTAVGQYAAAVRLSEAWKFVPLVILSSLYPAIVNARKEGILVYKDRLSNLYSFMIYTSVAISILMSFSSSRLVEILFGSSYSQAADVLIVHIWSCVFVFIGVSSGKWLLTEGLQIYSAINAFIGVIINIGLNYFLIPRYGLLGAAWATLFSYAFSGLICLALWARTRDNFLTIISSIFRLPRL